VPAGCPVPARFRTAFAEASRETGVPLSLVVAVAVEESGVRYLVRLLKRFGGDFVLALAAHNAGHGAVERAGGAPSEAVLRYAASVQARASTLPACDSV
jgi:hypothetical protein